MFGDIRVFLFFFHVFELFNHCSSPVFHVSYFFLSISFHCDNFSSHNNRNHYSIPHSMSFLFVFFNSSFNSSSCATIRWSYRFFIFFIFVCKSTRQYVCRSFFCISSSSSFKSTQSMAVRSCFVLIYIVRCTKTNEKAKNVINEIETNEIIDLVAYDGKNGTNKWRRKKIITIPEPEAYCVVSFHFRSFIISIFFF